MAIVYTNEQNYADIADAIRTKNGSETLYKPSEMAAAINALNVSGVINLQNKSVTPSTSEQEITYDTGYNGLGTVTVDRIPSQYIIPSGSITITENGTTNVAQYASATVNVSTGSTINNQDKTVNPSITAQTITADNGYTGLGTVTVNAIETTTHPAPTVTINTSNGLITASHAQTAGYVEDDTTTGTLQLSTQAAKIINPTTTVLTAVAANKYTTGAVTVAAIPYSELQHIGVFQDENGYLWSGKTTNILKNSANPLDSNY